MSRVYSTVKAKARFHELLRQVRSGQRVRISKEVAEVRPLEPRDRSFSEHLAALERAGVLTRRSASPAQWKPIAGRPGALQRFLAARE